MSTLLHVLAMGGYARYVWPAYGVALAVLLWMIVDSLASYRRSGRELETLERRRTKR